MAIRHHLQEGREMSKWWRRLKAKVFVCRFFNDLLERKMIRLEAENARLTKVIEDMDFQSGCSWCEKNNKIRSESEGVRHGKADNI